MDEKPASAAANDRRTTPRRRLRDRVASLDHASNPALARHELKNWVLLVEDDLRETALALGRVEAFLTRAMSALEGELSAAELSSVADDPDVLHHVESLADSLANLRHRMRRIAASLE